MRKFIVGVVVGALVTFGVSAVADSVSKIGKTITNEYVVKVNGSPLEVKAIAVDGTSYAPLRVVATEAGFDVDFSNGEISLTKEEVDTGMVKPVSEDYIEDRIRSLISGIEARKSNMELTEEQLKTAEARFQEPLLRHIEKLKEEIKTYEKELAELQLVE